MNIPTLETERLILRKFMENDLEALYKIYSDKEANKFLPWFPLKTREDAKTFFEKQLVRKYNQGYTYNYAVCLKAVVNQLNLDGNDDRVYMGYWNGSAVHFVERGI